MNPMKTTPESRKAMRVRLATFPDVRRDATDLGDVLDDLDLLLECVQERAGMLTELQQTQRQRDESVTCFKSAKKQRDTLAARVSELERENERLRGGPPCPFCRRSP